MDVAAAIDAEAVAVTRRTRGTATYDSGGNAVPGAASDTSIQAALQPMSGKRLLDLPEGLRAEASLLGWSRASVAVSDEIIYGGATYRVLHVWPRPADGFTKFALGVKTA